ncbi:MAG: DUF1501 domain-containing protein [Burkholderiales bacterium]
MKRRDFLNAASAGLACASFPEFVLAAPGADYGKLLVLIELKGGNDGLNTVVPFADPAYTRLRPRLGVKRDDVLMLDEASGLHPSLSALLPLWQAKELAIVQGVGYPQPNLSHFRSIEIWDTASAANEYLNEGWLARAFATAPVPQSFAAEGLVVGGQENGPLAGSRSIALANTEQFLRRARLAAPVRASGSAALAHVLKVETEIVQAANKLAGTGAPSEAFPAGELGNSLRVAAQVLAGGAKIAAIKVSLNGFDTHQNQPGVHANLLRQFAESVAAFRLSLKRSGHWDSTLIMTYAEFGRRPAENGSMGTDHGTANVQFVSGGRVKGGLYGEASRLDQLENGNLRHGIDFRSLYATVLTGWWGVDATRALGGRFAPLELLRAT